MALLEIDDIHVFYDNIEALKGVSINVEKGRIVTLVGANGAGKTTTLKAVSGLVHPRLGEIRFAGASLSDVPAHAIAAMGVRHVPEGRRIFRPPDRSREPGDGRLRPARPPGNRRGQGAHADALSGLARAPRPGCGDVVGRRTADGRHRARADGRPSVLLMDEPSMGLSPVMVEKVFETIRAINQQGVTILLVEQNAVMALDIADDAYVMESGRIVLSGPGQDLLDDERVQRAYLG